MTTDMGSADGSPDDDGSSADDGSSTGSDATDTGSDGSDASGDGSTDSDGTGTSSDGTDSDGTGTSSDGTGTSSDGSDPGSDGTDGSTDSDGTDTTSDGTDASSGDGSDTSTDTGSTDTGTTDSGSTDTGSTGSGDAGATSGDVASADSDPEASELADEASGGGASSDAGVALPTETGSAAGSGAATVPDDLGPPYLIVDQYPLDSGMNPPWATLVGRPEFYGVILKAWEGAKYNDGGWFAHNWPAVKQAGTTRYGNSWFRGAYLFLKFDTDGAAQADAYLHAVDAAGGWDTGDILPIIDVELGSPPNTNLKASKQQIIDCVSACAQRLKAQTKRRVMLYGRGAMRDLSINNKMGCDVVWNPSYTPTMHKAGLEAFTLDEIVLWQYCGDNEGYLANYPHQVDGFGKISISVFLKGSAAPTLDDARSSLLS